MRGGAREKRSGESCCAGVPFTMRGPMVRRLVVLALLALPLFAAETPVPPADLAAPPADAERAANGLVTKVLTAGTGTVKPDADSILRLRYTVWKQDGTLVQHVPESQTVLLGVQKMLPGWGEGAQQMVAGETRRIWIPHTLSAGKIKEGESLVIDTTLVEIVERPVAPPDVAAPPADAQVTSSGLAYKVLRPGTGSVKPKRRNTVEVHYTGWTTDGKMFDSSILRGQSGIFPLEEVIKGWTEGLQLMVEGEKARLWIPAKLAYGNKKGMPQGMLVFDIELIKILK